MKRVTLASVAVGLLAAAAATGHAQGAGGARKLRSALTINPLGLPAEYFAAEFETMASDIVSFGLAGSYFSPSDVTYASIEAKLRLYPNEEGPKGFAVGITGGISHVTENIFDGTEEKATRPTIGVVVDYNWILGKSSKVLVGAGLGMKRLIGSRDTFSDVDFTYPTARFQIGLRF